MIHRIACLLIWHLIADTNNNWIVWQNKTICDISRHSTLSSSDEQSNRMSEAVNHWVRCLHCCLFSWTSVDRLVGTCLPIYGVNEGESCQDDNDCEPGLRCLDNQPFVTTLSRRTKTCQPPGRDMMKKQYSKYRKRFIAGNANRGWGYFWNTFNIF